MTDASPLSRPTPWDLVAPAYIDEVMPLLERYAADALDLAGVGSDDRVLDVAAGPGTLTLLAAARARRVTAVDFSDDMLAILRRRIDAAGCDNIEVHAADGQALPFADAGFDAAFSMFGLMFFPDRGAGLRELRRVLAPGGRAVVSSWTRSDRVPLIAAVFDAISALLPELPFGGEHQPLAEPGELRDEMTAAGFDDVEIHTVTHRLEKPTARDFWDTQARSSAVIALLRRERSEDEWNELSEQIAARLQEQCGPGPVHLEWPANLALGVAH